MTVFILKVKGAPVAGCVTVVVALVKGSLTHVKYRLVCEQHTKTLTNRNQRSRSRIVVARQRRRTEQVRNDPCARLRFAFTFPSMCTTCITWPVIIIRHHHHHHHAACSSCGAVRFVATGGGGGGASPAQGGRAISDFIKRPYMAHIRLMNRAYGKSGVERLCNTHDAFGSDGNARSGCACLRLVLHTQKTRKSARRNRPTIYFGHWGQDIKSALIFRCMWIPRTCVNLFPDDRGCAFCLLSSNQCSS